MAVCRRIRELNNNNNNKQNQNNQQQIFFSLPVERVTVVFRSVHMIQYDT